MRRRWFPGFVTGLWMALIALSPTQAGAGETARTLIVAVEDVEFAPYHFRQGGRLVGISTDTVRAVAAGLGYRIEFRPAPWARVVETFRALRGDAVMDLLHKPAREAFLHYPAENLDYEVTQFFVSADSNLSFDGDLSALAGRTVGVVRGYFYGGEFEAVPGIELIELNNQATLVRNVAQGRIAIGIGTQAAIAHQAWSLGLEDQIRFLSPPLNRIPNFIAFVRHPGREDLARQFSAALTTFKASETYKAIRQRYTRGNE